MSETYRTLKTVSSTSRRNSLKNRPNSANSRATNTSMQLQKREKLKSLLIEKFVKSFSEKEYKYLIEAEVADFITKEKLTEIDLKNFENHLANLISKSISNNELNHNLDNYSSVPEVENKHTLRNYSNANRQNNSNTEGNSVSSNNHVNDFDKKRNYMNSALNNNIIKGNHGRSNNNKNTMSKNSFLKPAAKAYDGMNLIEKYNVNSKNYDKNSNFEKSKKIIIHKNNPTLMKKNNSNCNNTLLKKNINNNHNLNKRVIDSSKPKNGKESVFNDKISRISNESHSEQANPNSNYNNKYNLKLDNQAELNIKSIFQPNSRPMSVRNLNPKNLNLESQISQSIEDLSDLDVDEIKNFELKKLFKNEQKPLERLNFESEADEWQAIENYKKSLHQSKLAESRKTDWETKLKNREAFDKQLEEKALAKDKKRVNELAYHEKVMSNVEKLYTEETRKLKEIEDRKLKEKEFREMQIQESIIKKKQNYLENMITDKKLCKRFFYFLLKI